jgi:hypothetical protein
MAKKRQRIDTMIDFHVWEARKARKAAKQKSEISRRHRLKLSSNPLRRAPVTRSGQGPGYDRPADRAYQRDDQGAVNSRANRPPSTRQRRYESIRWQAAKTEH